MFTNKLQKSRTSTYLAYSLYLFIPNAYIPEPNYVNNVAKNNVKAYLLHESLSVLVFELCPIEDLLARYHANGEIICRELASKTKKSHLIKLPKYLDINIITSYISNTKTLYPLQA